MSAGSAAAVPASAPAVDAFLRGVGRRALVFAELQAGEAARADAALAAAVDAFRADAPMLELARWPHAFWASVVNAPALRGGRPGDTGWSRIAAGPRAALLLRLAAGLDETDAARVLGVGVPAYRLAVQRALPRDADGFAPLQVQVQRELAAVSPERIERFACGTGGGAAHDGKSAALPPRPAPRAVLAVLWALLLLCVAAFAATFWWPLAGASGGTARLQALPPAAPASRYRSETQPLVHRDFALLVDTDAAPFVRDLEFYSWLAAQAVAGGPADAGGPVIEIAPDGAPVPPFERPADAGLETADAAL